MQYTQEQPMPHRVIQYFDTGVVISMFGAGAAYWLQYADGSFPFSSLLMSTTFTTPDWYSFLYTFLKDSATIFALFMSLRAAYSAIRKKDMEIETIRLENEMRKEGLDVKRYWDAVKASCIGADCPYRRAHESFTKEGTSHD